jgi:glucose-6-phosphate 1-dehydrogenase
VRDILQNHLLQVCALLLMDEPSSWSAEDVAAEKERTLRLISPLEPEDTLLAQYEGYKEEPGVADDSVACTYAACVLHMDCDRWRGVPLLLKAGKGLDTSATTARVHFRSTTPGDTGSALTFYVQPNPGYSISVPILTDTSSANENSFEAADFAYRYKGMYDDCAHLYLHLPLIIL